MLARLARALARSGRIGPALYRRFAHPGGREWADYLRARGALFHLGRDCTILPSAVFTDPDYTWIGDGACLGSCKLICHDGSVEMVQRAYGVRLDRTGFIRLENDVYIGEDAIILGSEGVTIGAGTIIGAGAVVRQSAAPGSIVAGNPAKVVGRVEDIIRFWEADLLDKPWAEIIAAREGAFDPAVEPLLRVMRHKLFFGGERAQS